ncbi:flagellar basal body-associated FliL family protein [Sporanaerobacter acetigenes]|uniref:Flagellar protein FliL n=1 Tax=Sporanaerobacter acetigenes DSM 13106 TaxID=1123281 RepID=A0A1M5Y070_9FIRM|nr:flagellar basal body-associated FliL family protein [Sporanaerobacter acetigenes]SHI05366.1 flagellar FliL protein [Sporanaerobacter acetigenes DSM 13106]
MDTKKIILIVVLVAVIVFAIFGTILGFIFYKNNDSNKGNTGKNKNSEQYYITLEDMYCNIKESKKIVRLKITVEISDKDTFEKLENKQFLMRDEINKIIRNKKEEDLQGKDGQLTLQSEIRNSLIELFDNENITNIYFNDLIIQ